MHTRTRNAFAQVRARFPEPVFDAVFERACTCAYLDDVILVLDIEARIGDYCTIGRCAMRGPYRVLEGVVRFKKVGPEMLAVLYFHFPDEHAMRAIFEMFYQLQEGKQCITSHYISM